jgi:hypothetical protein
MGRYRPSSVGEGPDVFVYPSLYSCDDGYLSFLLFIRECWVKGEFWLTPASITCACNALMGVSVHFVSCTWALFGFCESWWELGGHFAFLLRPRRRVVLAGSTFRLVRAHYGPLFAFSMKSPCV